MEDELFKKRAEEIWELVDGYKTSLPKEQLIEAISNHLQLLVNDYRLSKVFSNDKTFSYKEEFKLLLEQVGKHLDEAEQYTQASYHCASDISETDNDFETIKKELKKLGKNIRSSIGDLLSLKNSFFI